MPDFNFGFILLIFLGLWALSGFYRVQPAEDAVVMTFGKATSTKTEPGWGYHIPWPVQSIVKTDVGLDRRITVGFSEGSRGGDLPFESLMLTGDENIININFVVLWRINDAKKYLFEIRDPDSTIKKVAESAMREIIGRTEIQKALTEARGEIETNTRDLMQKILDDYSAGVAINSVQLLKVDPPGQVVDAFNDVQRARAEKEQARNVAEAYSNDILPKARGDAQKIVQDAEAYRAAEIDKAKGEASRFLSVYSAYQQGRDVTARRMYLETLEHVLQNSKKIITDEGKGTPVLPYMSLDTISPAKKTTAQN